jgi:hypothetical protein
MSGGDWVALLICLTAGVWFLGLTRTKRYP